MRRFIFLLPILFLGVGVFSEETAKEYKPSEVETLRLQVKQREAQLAQKDLALAQKLVETAQQSFQTSLLTLTAESEKIKTDEKWPSDTAFDPNTLKFTAPLHPATVAPIPAKK